MDAENISFKVIIAQHENSTYKRVFCVQRHKKMDVENETVEVPIHLLILLLLGNKK